MPKPLTESAVFTGTISVPTNSEAATADSVEAPIQGLTNRTRYLETMIGSHGAGAIHPFQELVSASALSAYSGYAGSAPERGEIVLVVDASGRTQGAYRYDPALVSADFVAPLAYQSTVAPGGWRLINYGTIGVPNGSAGLAGDGLLASAQVRGYYSVSEIDGQTDGISQGAAGTSLVQSTDVELQSWVRSYVPNGVTFDLTSSITFANIGTNVSSFGSVMLQWQANNASSFSTIKTRYWAIGDTVNTAGSRQTVMINSVFATSSPAQVTIRWVAHMNSANGSTNAIFDGATIRWFRA